MYNKIVLTNEVVEANKGLIVAICDMMETNHDIKIEDVQDITIYEMDNNILNIEVEGFEFTVSDDYTALEELATEQVKEIIEDCGLTQNLIDEAYIKGWIDESWFEDYWREHNEFLAYEEDIQYIATEEELEELENGQTTEEEIREHYYNDLQSSIENNWVDEFKYQLGDEEFQRVLLQENLIDIDEVANWCVEMDGVAHTLAHYDGDEIECNGYYIYRTN